MTITEAAKWLQERDNFLVIAHKRPDGDAIGSAAGLAKGLKLAGKTAYILPNPEMTKKFVPYVTKIDAPADFVPEYIVTVDTASEGMFQINASDYTDKADLAIDHHVSNTGYAKNVCVLPECAACGEIVYHILTEMGVQVDSETATLLYIAVSTDTGCFAYTNTVAETLETAGKLVAAGADSKSVNKKTRSNDTWLNLKISKRSSQILNPKRKAMPPLTTFDFLSFTNVLMSSKNA